MTVHDLTFYDVINRNAVAFGNKFAWMEIKDGHSFTFSKFKNEVDRLSAGLRQLGVSRGDRIAVVAKNSLSYFLLFGASSALGAIFLPVNWRLSEKEIRYILTDGGPGMLFAGKEYRELISGMRNDLPFVTHCFGLDFSDETFRDFRSLTENKAAFVPPAVSSNDGCVIIHTAAVSGKPKGALLSHGNVLCANLHFDYYLNLTERDVHLSYLPLFHVGGLLMAAAAFQAGALNVSMPKFDAELAMAAIKEQKVSCLMDFAPVLLNLLDKNGETGGHLTSLQKVAGIDTPDTIKRYQRETGGTFWCLYGQTETSGLASFGTFDERPGSAGKVLPLADVRLVDETGQPVPAGEVGEIVMKGPMVFTGYWRLPDETADTFRNGWHHTGDSGVFDEDGYLWFKGRKPEKELIKPGGENVYPAEVENVILRHPAVENVVVFGVPDPKWKEGIKAVCQLTGGKSLTPKALIDFVGGKIAGYKKPRYVEFVTDMPLAGDGKPDRAAVKKRFGEDL